MANSVIEAIAEARAKGWTAMEICSEYAWLQSGKQCVEECTLDWGRCRQPAYGVSKRCYYHGKKERGLIG